VDAPTEVFDVSGMLARLDRLFSAGEGPDAAAALLDQSLAEAESLGDRAARLAILNELMGLMRATGDHDRSLRAAAEARELSDALGWPGTENHVTTLINIATAQRAAGQSDEARATYDEALEQALAVLDPDDRRLAALRNNLAILLGDRGDPAAAHEQLLEALAILERTTVDPDRDVDIAGTLTNLSLVCHDLGRGSEAAARAQEAAQIFEACGREDGHAAAGLAGLAESCFRRGETEQAVGLYRRALDMTRTAFGESSDQYVVTAENLAHAEQAAAAMASGHGTAPVMGSVTPGGAVPSPESATGSGAAPRTPPAQSAPVESGLSLARAFWEEHVRPMVQARPALHGRVAAGLVGHGSECYGFDDAVSRDHDFGPGVCLWLTREDMDAHGEELQAAYDALPRRFRGVGPRVATARSAREQRVGVFEIGDFFERLTGLRAAPDDARAWVTLHEPTLAVATNGAVFADPLGAFGAARGGFLRMPDDVLLMRLGQRIAMMAQAGQYNVPRMLDRADGEAAWAAVGEFVAAAASAVFLLNRPSSVGYLPYYKWRPAALRALAARPGSRVPTVHRDLGEAVRLASAACLGGVEFGEGGAGARGARRGLEGAIERACAAVVDELRVQRLSTATDTFLEPHRDELRARIRDPWLRSV